MKKESSFKMKNPSVAKLAKEAGKPSVLKSNTDGVFDITTKRKVKREAKQFLEGTKRYYKKLYRRAKRGDVGGMIKDKKRVYKKLFRSVKQMFN